MSGTDSEAVSNPQVVNTVSTSTDLGETTPVTPYSIPVAGGYAYVCGTGHAHVTYGAAERCEKPVAVSYVVRWDFERYVPARWQGTRACSLFGERNTGVTVDAVSAEEAVQTIAAANRLNPFYLTAVAR